jgi:hypothetical protein
MITDNSTSRLAEIKAFAKENGFEESFKEVFSRFGNYSDVEYDVLLYSDFAPLSLDFVTSSRESLF